MTTQADKRRESMRRRKSARVGVALGGLQRALEEGDSAGDEKIMAAMTYLIEWRKQYGTS